MFQSSLISPRYTLSQSRSNNEFRLPRSGSMTNGSSLVSPSTAGGRQWDEEIMYRRRNLSSRVFQRWLQVDSDGKAEL